MLGAEVWLGVRAMHAQSVKQTCKAKTMQRALPFWKTFRRCLTSAVVLPPFLPHFLPLVLRPYSLAELKGSLGLGDPLH